MKILFVVLAFLFSAFQLNSQIYETVDINKIETEIINENSPNFYPKLFARYAENDTTLNLDAYRYLYYGHALQPYYNPAIPIRNDSVLALRNYLKTENADFKRIIEMAKFIMRLDPFYIDGIYMLSVAYDKTGDKINSALWLDKYNKIIQTVWGSGNGRAPETAFSILSITDEYSVLSALELKQISHSSEIINEKHYDIFIIEKNKYDIEKIYFSTELLYNHIKKTEK